MQIHNLPERSAIADTDVYAVDTGTTTGKTPFSLIKSLIKTFTLQFSDLTLKTTASNNDVFAIDDGTGSKKIRFSELKNLVVQNATPGYNSGDSETVDATSWTDVAKVTSGLTFTTTLNRITTMMKNARYLYNLLGSTNISGTGKSTVTEAIGGTDMSGISQDGTISGALANLNSNLYALRNKFVAQRLTKTVNSGYFTITYPTGVTYSSHDLIIQPMYGGGLIGWAATVQLTSAQVNVYVRIGSTIPANGSSIDCLALFIER